MFDDIIKPKKVKVWGQKTLEKNREKTSQGWKIIKNAGYSRGTIIAKSHKDNKILGGSFYSLKITKGADADEYIIWPSNSIDHLPEFYRTFAGRIVTFGCWEQLRFSL